MIWTLAYAPGFCIIANVNLSLNGSLSANDKSDSRRAGLAIGSWAEENLYCPNCSSSKLKWQDERDLTCSHCHSQYQLNGQKTRIGSTIAGGAYSPMMRGVRTGNGPSHYVMHYAQDTWSVQSLLLVPHFAIPPSAVVKGKGTAGCRLALNKIPTETRIAIITTIKSSDVGDTECIMIARPEEVREKFRRLKSAYAKLKG